MSEYIHISILILSFFLPLFFSLPPHQTRDQPFHPFELPRQDEILAGIEETSTNQIAVKLKDNVDVHEFALRHGLDFVKCLEFSSSLCIFSPTPNSKRDVRDIAHELRQNPSIEWAEEQIRRLYSKFQSSPTSSLINNPQYSASWHFDNYFPGFEDQDVNILPAWNSGWSGRGVNIGVVDDSVEWQHSDLIQFYSPETSWDFNDNDPDPSPKKSTDTHGTSVAGVALGRNNNACTVGAGFNALLSGLRLISDSISDVQIAQCLTFSEKIQIYSNSWGWSTAFALPLSSVLQSAFTSGVTQGRGGRGFIYTWAAGNSRTSFNNANYDSLANAPETIAVAAVSFRGVYSSYSNPGCALLISAPSSGDGLGIYTTDRTGSLGYSPTSCTGDFGGTSSACPLVSGIISLILEANPNLGWRDMQWVLATSARRNDLSNGDWRQNGAGLWVNHNYGFGVIDATRAIEIAKGWKNVPPRASIVQAASIGNGAISGSGFIYEWKISTDFTVEHAQVKVRISGQAIKNLAIDLTSPSGTLSRLLEQNAPTNISQLSWTFMTIFNLGENARGKWTLRLRDTTGAGQGIVVSAALIIWGHKAPVQLNVDTGRYCPSQQVDFAWSDSTIKFLTLKGPSSRTVDVTGATSRVEVLPWATWTASISVDPNVPLDTQTFTPPNCQTTSLLVQVLDCGNVHVSWGNAVEGSSVFFQETTNKATMPVTTTPISGTGGINTVRPYYGAWVAIMVSGSSTIATSNSIAGQLCSTPIIEIDTSQQCSSSATITITARNTQYGMTLTTQPVNTAANPISLTDLTNTNEPLVLKMHRPSQAGTWSVRILYGSQVFAQSTFEVSLCANRQVWVETQSV